MNTKVFLTVIILGLSTLFTACEDDSTDSPVITLHELGLDDSHEAHVGDDLHIDAEIIADGTIEKIVVELHAEDGDDELEVEFIDGYNGLKNAEFHEHVEIPATFTPGEYHFHLLVTDKEGNQSSVEAHVDIEEETNDGGDHDH
ncbi:DUF4625 domain-containing protein [Carboxylicivirga sp. N1Y90]|uniref:DUF4625 domain-containing protein n=1 Tax=Carboxylicivirga fragile TaxID=3417571 RepID=UPI003D34E369|nr:DUF4625 domain-containing protein [Marinilabiliaceae bacterium N1Y90]